MLKTALLLLTGPLHIVVESLGHYFSSAKNSLVKSLYVKLEPELFKPFTKADSQNLSRLSNVVPILYSKASSIYKDSDVRLLLTNFSKPESKYKNIDFDLVLTNSDADDNEIYNYVSLNYECKCKNIIKIGNVSNGDCINNEVQSDFKVYKTVCLGGTFDHLHNGHKVLLTESILRAKEKLIVGVSEGRMIHKKILWELIDPVEKRIEELSNFLTEVDPTLCYEVVPITDPYGPTIINPDIDCLVVTIETKIGGDKVNIERKNRGMHELNIHVVDLVENKEHSAEEDEKLSSSTQRMHQLGTLLKPVDHLPSDDKPYCILLQGYSSSSKNKISGRLQALGVAVLCCDEIADAILNKNKNLLKEFSNDFSDVDLTNSNTSCKELFSACLLNKKRKEWLQDKLYSKMRLALLQVLEVYSNQGTKIILIKDSSLFEGQDLKINFQEKWATILPLNESIKKLKDEYDFTEDEATVVKESYPSNEEYISNANRIFCCLWSDDAIQRQVERAWNGLKAAK